MPKWTDDQLKAIEGRGGSLVVSAAAGSGKTAVLVERVIRRLTDTENRCPADKLVIVTFTRAAAAQMKERIEAALEAKIAVTADAWLMQQQLLLQSAKICTVDSFCADIVRENFQETGISANFAVADSGEQEGYCEKALKTVLDEMYSTGGDGFILLTDILSSGASDKGLEEAVKRIHTIVSSYPFPQDALDKLFEPYFDELPVEQSCWGSFLLEDAAVRFDYCRSLMQSAEALLSDINADRATVDALSEMVLDEKQMYEKLTRLAKAKQWDELVFAVNSRSYCRFSAKRNLDAALKADVKIRRDKAKKTADSAAEKFCCTAEEFADDMSLLRPCAKALKECVSKYTDELLKIKRQAEKFDFNDVEHIALELLVKKDENGVPQKTPLALALSEQFVEIMVDEYQDTNELQDMIFSAISKNESNMFFVGDVKQSIYRFRQAMPEIFLNRRDSVPAFDGENYPARVTLGANFRSKSNVTKAINFLFSQLMSPELGEIDYNENEQLNAMASGFAEHSEADVEFWLRDASDQISEPEFVAEYVEKLLASGRLIKDGDAHRPVTPGDICILTRVKKPMMLYAAALEERGIPAVSFVEGEINCAAEVKMIISLLKILDNPLQDIPLAAVMMSPVFGFDSTQLANIRMGTGGRVPLYRSVVAAADNGDAKCRSFLGKIDIIRRVGIGMGAAELLRRIFDETGIFSIAKALSSPEQRVANLHSLLDCASGFDSSGGCGISAFLRYIEKSKGVGTEYSVAENSHAVKVMNTHKSKGLEFPVCILADLSSNLVHGERSAMSLSRSFGAGLVVKDGLSGKTVKTLPFVACNHESMLRDLSEEVRILYVALTRAKELLVFVGSQSNPADKAANTKLAFCNGTKALDYGYSVSANCALDWLLPVFCRHSDAAELYTLADIDRDRLLLSPDFSLKARYCTDESVRIQPTENNEEKISSPPDMPLALQIKERMDYVYPYAALSGASSKKLASVFNQEAFDDSFFACSRPAFMNSGGLTAAQKGTLTHRFMQLCDVGNPDVKSQLDRMAAEGIFSETEIKEMKTDELEAFFDSELCRRIKSAQNVMREKKFAMLMPVTEAYPDLPESFAEETIVVQGMLDLAFVEDGEIVIVDYKTDRGVNEQELAERHREQLCVYKTAMERCTDYKVKAAYIYSLPLKKEIKVC
ncbi:MAG: helicase-exonuclease AddAB subunit AddA [Clostridia bacterium]|nr:helicase-exonuclease AddAB subunit AddA [Clostridia bacterium]